MTSEKSDKTKKTDKADKTQKDDKDVGIADVIKKVVSIGVGAAFMTEDAVKSLLSDLPIPKDIISGLVNNAKSAKEEFVQSLGSEMRNYLAKLDVKKVIDDVVDRYDIEITSTIKLKKKDEQAPKD
ncbi:MAG: hypothetical protein ISR65_10370 [Bacteriovoracaceae bacterium]|nr:hypothetical protein [Bacteriovoracaceae bacterium]